MVTASQSGHNREIGACWGNPADHGLSGVLDLKKLSSSACQFERALREKVVGQDQAVDQRYGARHLKRAIERHVVYPIARLLATAQVHEGDVLVIDRHPPTKLELSYETRKTGCRPKHHFGGQARGSTYAESVGANIGVKNELSL